MSLTNKSDRITRYAVALQGAHHKTINVKLNNNLQARVTALQIDNQDNVVSTRTLQPEQSDASFDFYNDGELWLVGMNDGNETPSSEDAFTVAMGDIQLNLQVQTSDGGGTRDVTSNPTPVKKPDEA